MTFEQIYNHNISLGIPHNSAVSRAYQQMSATDGRAAAEQAMNAFLRGGGTSGSSTYSTAEAMPRGANYPTAVDTSYDPFARGHELLGGLNQAAPPEVGTEAWHRLNPFGTTPGAPSGTTPGAPSGTTGGIAGLPGEDYTPDPPPYISTPFGDFSIEDIADALPNDLDPLSVGVYPRIAEWLSSRGSFANPSVYSFPGVMSAGDFFASGAGAGGDMGTSPASGLGSFDPGMTWAREQTGIADWRAGIGHHPLSPDLTQHLGPTAFGQYVDQHYGGFVDWETFSSHGIGDQGRYGEYLDYLVANKPHAMEPYLWYLAAWDAVNINDIENIREASNRLYSDPESAFFGLTLEGNIDEWWPYFQGMQPLGIRILEPESSTSGYGYEITSDITGGATPPVTTTPDVTTPTDVITPAETEGRFMLGEGPTPPMAYTNVGNQTYQVDPSTGELLQLVDTETYLPIPAAPPGMAPEAYEEVGDEVWNIDPSTSERLQQVDPVTHGPYEPPDQSIAIEDVASGYGLPDTSGYDPAWTTPGWSGSYGGEGFQSGGAVEAPPVTYQGIPWDIEIDPAVIAATQAAAPPQEAVHDPTGILEGLGYGTDYAAEFSSAFAEDPRFIDIIDRLGSRWESLREDEGWQDLPPDLYDELYALQMGQPMTADEWAAANAPAPDPLFEDTPEYWVYGPEYAQHIMDQVAEIRESGRETGWIPELTAEWNLFHGANKDKFGTQRPGSPYAGLAGLIPGAGTIPSGAAPWSPDLGAEFGIGALAGESPFAAPYLLGTKYSDQQIVDLLNRDPEGLDWDLPAPISVDIPELSADDEGLFVAADNFFSSLQKEATAAGFSDTDAYLLNLQQTNPDIYAQVINAYNYHGANWERIAPTYFPAAQAKLMEMSQAPGYGEDAASKIEAILPIAAYLAPALGLDPQSFHDYLQDAAAAARAGEPVDTSWVTDRLRGIGADAPPGLLADQGGAGAPPPGGAGQPPPITTTGGAAQPPPTTTTGDASQLPPATTTGDAATTDQGVAGGDTANPDVPPSSIWKPGSVIPPSFGDVFSAPPTTFDSAATNTLSSSAWKSATLGGIAESERYDTSPVIGIPEFVLAQYPVAAGGADPVSVWMSVSEGTRDNWTQIAESNGWNTTVRDIASPEADLYVTTGDVTEYYLPQWAATMIQNGLTVGEGAGVDPNYSWWQSIGPAGRLAWQKYMEQQEQAVDLVAIQKIDSSGDDLILSEAVLTLQADGSMKSTWEEPSEYESVEIAYSLKPATFWQYARVQMLKDPSIDPVAGTRWAEGYDAVGFNSGWDNVGMSATFMTEAELNFYNDNLDDILGEDAWSIPTPDFLTEGEVSGQNFGIEGNVAGSEIGNFGPQLDMYDVYGTVEDPSEYVLESGHDPSFWHSSNPSARAAHVGSGDLGPRGRLLYSSQDMIDRGAYKGRVLLQGPQDQGFWQFVSIVAPGYDEYLKDWESTYGGTRAVLGFDTWVDSDEARLVGVAARPTGDSLSPIVTLAELKAWHTESAKYYAQYVSNQASRYEEDEVMNIVASEGYSHGGSVYGGIAGLGSRGGGYVPGVGGGMDDGIAAIVDGGSPAKLSSGEFVIPADVVSHLGDGNNSGGVSSLQGMVDRVRMTKTGSLHQPGPIQESAVLPA